MSETANDEISTQRTNPVYDILAGDSAFPEGRARLLECSDGSLIVKGVRVPAMVASQLRALGMPLDAYSVGELEDAIAAYTDDGSLIEDDEGLSFADRLYLSQEERQERMERREAYRDRNARLHKHLYCDIGHPSDEQLYNPWYEGREMEQTDRQASDSFEIMHFGHEGLFHTIREPRFYDHIANANAWEYQHDDVLPHYMPLN